MIYKIWAEGYECTGQSSKANFMGEQEADSFQEACDKFFMDKSKPQYETHAKCYELDTLSYWGCSLFDNKADASKAFG
jgi:hypothetical protein